MLNATAERLRRNVDKIMKLWETRAKNEIHAALNQESLALQNSLSEYLKQLIDALSTTIDRTDARIKADRIESERIGRKHGQGRAKSRNYTIDQLIYEYHILRQVICDVMEEEAILTPIEREVIVTSIEQAVNDAATEFNDSIHQIQEKFTHTLAHDLRNPITAAKASAQLILRRPEDVDQCIKAASWISTSMDRLDSMIHDLLDASKIRAGQSLPLQFSKCDLDMIARQVAAEANFIHGSRFVVDSKNGHCIGYWNENGLRRMLENLVNNAAKYGASNTSITIKVDQTESKAMISIHNYGEPIPSTDISLLFQQFRRARSAESKTGWGLGLTVVKGMVEAHHGSIQVESNVGIGTTFTIELPKTWRKSAD